MRDALRQTGRDERVVGSVDSLSFGPINSPDPELRRKSVEEDLEDFEVESDLNENAW